MYNVTGIEMIAETTTSSRLCLKKEKRTAPTELHNTFLIPISFVRERTVKSVNPNKPNAEIISVNKANREKIVLRFFSDA